MSVAPKIIAAGLLALAASLLIGARFSASWAGGTGIARQYPAHLVGSSNDKTDKTITRGETISTSASDFASYNLATTNDKPSTNIHLAPRTAVVLQSNSSSAQAINLLEGRLIVNGALDIIARNIVVHASDRTMITNYSWKYEFEVINLGDAPLTITRNSDSITLAKNHGALLNIVDETKPIDASLEFIETPTTKPLIDWAKQMGF